MRRPLHRAPDISTSGEKGIDGKGEAHHRRVGGGAAVEEPLRDSGASAPGGRTRPDAQGAERAAARIRLKEAVDEG